NSKNGVTVTFADATNKDFHLRVGDSAARGYGANLKNDANLAFDTDIDNENRPETGAWDIGADEVARTTQVNSPISGRFLDSSLVGYWSFDGANMGTTSARDLSGNNNTGWLLNGVKKTEGINGQALSFDGVDDYVNVADSNSLDITNNLTLSFWMKAANLTQTNSYLLSKLSGSSNNAYSVVWEYANNTVEFYAISYGFGRPSTNSQITINDTNWHHIIYTYDGATWRGYKDGVEAITPVSLVSSLTATAGNLLIGSFNGTQYLFNGLIDDVRVYNRALSAGEITDLYNLGASRLTVNAPPPSIANTSGSLVGYWTFNGADTNWSSATAGTTNDLSGSGNTGTMTNMSQSLSPVPGISGQALKFNGVSSYVNVGNVLATGEKTISFWFKSNSISRSKFLVYFVNTGYTNVDFLVVGTSGSKILASGNDAGASSATINSTLLSSQWYHVTVVKTTGDVSKIYINGIDDTLATSGFYEGAIVNSLIGSGWYFDGGAETYVQGNYFNGSIDDVRIYNRALTAGEILQLYNLGARRAKIKQ
ncbi:LamG domain-containing protein, partial [Patescibacteria group bacterium]|nr:LamG domain-containing protein [Patescibacteria group bacterium]